jgi:hypothetical protein
MLHQFAFACLDRAYEALIEGSGDRRDKARFESWSVIVNRIMGCERNA